MLLPCNQEGWQKAWMVTQVGLLACQQEADGVLQGKTVAVPSMPITGPATEQGIRKCLLNWTGQGLNHDYNVVIYLFRYDLRQVTYYLGACFL